MKKILLILMLLVLCLPYAFLPVLAQNNDSLSTGVNGNVDELINDIEAGNKADLLVAIKTFCDDDESAKLARKTVTSISNYCSKPTCDRLANAIFDGPRTQAVLETELNKLAAEKVDEKKVLQDKIAAINKFLANRNINSMKADCDAVDDLVIEQQNLQAAQKKTLLGTMGSSCVNLTSADTSICERTDTEFAQLQDAILLGNLVTILEEPISNENVYNRAKICELNFVRDSKGELQPVPGAPNHYAIRPTDCESYIVEKCVPTRSNLSSVTLVRQDNGSYKLNVAGNETGVLPTVVYCDKVQAIWADSGVNLLKSYIGFIYRWAAGIVGVIAVLVIMVSGIQISASGGEAIDEAKGRIVQSIIALAVLFLSGIILYAVNPTFFTPIDVQDQQKQLLQEAATEAAAEEAATTESGSMR
ncbi:hypothetical protein COV81_02760 [Candidatus Peregrinibacteria bacterium CG11_big_fil_rev_8_21_14_0_20_41_10]|nr:MAG: hypothetical protein COV81_02760 [Candidatus Peregrinibacteria bacterium CG11_big_fil_rev_8_21_14_0_20_41_10]PIZ76577.1 MAG: hypothetical protein COY06_01765 [Candidatus Peregrinibacteria bacterium CG_4_10_14_0_2_um_filter_41_8]PJC37663.1 MAG: hypothetical protein CO045_04175 [Candidatus Peregrinibacteria bacterium CG_4_9_14_0_2_um_filter_41_14]